MPSEKTPTRSGYVGLIRQNRSLRYLWMGRMVSNMGDWFNLIALFLAVQSLSSSAQAVTLVIVAKTLPIFLMSPISGPLVDRYDRRRLMIGMDLVRFVGVFGLIAAYWLDSLVGLYLCTTLMVCATGIAIPATSAALPMVVTPEQIPMSNALLGGTWSLGLMIGAALGGAATELLGTSAALFIDAGTFALSAVFTSQLPRLPAVGASARESDLDSDNSVDTPHRDTSFMAGVRYLYRSPYILCVTGLKSLMQLYGGLNALLPLYGTTVFVGVSGPLYVGVLYAVRGLGAAIGSLVVRAMFGDSARVLRVIIAVSFGLSGLAFAGLAMATEFWHAALAFLVSSIGQSAVHVFSTALLQMEANPQYHGRVFALDFGVMTLVLAAGSYGFGLALDLGWSMRDVVLTGASLSIVPLILWSCVVWRTARTRSD